MKTGKKDALVPFKPCPKCGGAGRVPCTGLELHKERNRQWAMLHHMRPVVVKWLEYKAPGIAIARLCRGGWYCLRIYISKSNSPPFSGFIPWDVAVEYGSFCAEGAYDRLNGKRVWYVECAWSSKKEVVILEEIPKELAAIKLLAEGSVK